MTGQPGSARGLASIGLHRPELRAWAMYDWGLSAYETTIVTAIFPVYYLQVAAADLPGNVATQHMAWANTAMIAFVAVLAPALGAIADYAAAKKRMLGVFLLGGALATGAMFLIQRGDHVLAVVLFVLAGIGAQGSRVFYDALLPHIADEQEVDRVSTAGYALGYVGGGLLLALNLAWYQQPAWFGLPSGEDLTPAESTLPLRLAFASVAVWWVLFSIPLFRRVPEPERALVTGEALGMNPVRVGLGRLRRTLRELRGYRNASLMLLAFVVYNDGISTIQRMATIYAAEVGIGTSELLTAVLMIQFVGIPCTFLFGAFAGVVGAKRSIYAGLAVFLVVSGLGYYMRTATHFFVLAFLWGLVQGGVQGISRSLFASMIPRHRSGELFGFYSVFSRFAAVVGPATFALVVAATGQSRNAILALVVFFVAGAALLSLVDVEEGRREAGRAEGSLRVV